MSGLPGTSGFVGEFLTLIGTFRVNIWSRRLATLGVILSAAYALWLYRKVIFGALEKPKLAAIKDLDYREIITLGPLAALTILFGIFPKPILDMSAASVAQLIAQYQAALGARQDRRHAGEVSDQRSTMNETFVVRDLLPALPEIVLAVGAMALLMLGAFRGERAVTAGQLALRSCC